MNQSRPQKTQIFSTFELARNIVPMVSSASDELQYDCKSIRKFENYFIKPKPKRGRPKKRKRGRKPKKKAQSANAKQTMMSEGSNEISLTGKQKELLDARLEGSLRKLARTSEKPTRINWDKGEHAVLRKRYADSWFKSTDLFKKGESFRQFCKRMGIDRTVLKRYLKGKYVDQEMDNRRGRKTALSSSVMRHLCEGKCIFCSCYFISA